MVEVVGKKICNRMYPWGIEEGTYCGRGSRKKICGRIYPLDVVEGTYCGRGNIISLGVYM